MTICHRAPRPIRTWSRLARPLLVAAASWFGLAQSAAHDEHGEGVVIAGVLLLAALICCAGIVIGLAITVRRIWRCLRGKSQRGVERRDRDVEEALRMARVLQVGLLANRQITPLTVWGLVLQSGETAHLDLPVDVQRGVDLSAQTGRVIVTDRRLLCELGDGWASLWYDAVIGFSPAIDHCAVVLDLADRGRIQLRGYAAPLIAVYVTFRLYGQDGLRNHPSLQPLDRVASLPSAATSMSRRSS